MLIGTVWIRVNTGIDADVVDFYFSLLVAGSLALVISALVEPRFNTDLTRLKLLPFIQMFGVAMVAIFVVFAVMAFAGGGWRNPGLNQTVFANYLAMTILLVAPVETLVFQYIVPKMATMTLVSANLQVLGGLLSQVTFGLFHFVAYGGSLGSMGFAVLLGMGFYALVRSNATWGLGAAMGLHAGWNISVTMFNVAVFTDLWGSLLPIPGMG